MTAVVAVLGVLAGVLGCVVMHRIPTAAGLAWPPPPPDWTATIRPWRALRYQDAQSYLVFQLAMAAVFVVVWSQIGARWALPAFLLFAWVLVVVSVIDAGVHKIPNRLLYPLTPVLAVALAVGGVLDGSPWAGVRAIVAGLLAFAALLVVVAARPQSMGMGDVKLGGFVGLGLGFLGWVPFALGFIGSFLLGGGVALVMLVTRQRGLTDVLPFGPFLAIGAFVTVIGVGSLSATGATVVLH